MGRGSSGLDACGLLLLVVGNFPVEYGVSEWGVCEWLDGICISRPVLLFLSY